jgi:NUMOD3 motif
MGRKHSAATKNKIRLAHLVVKESEAKIGKMHKIFAGKNNPMYGRKQSKSQKKKIV